mgnify:CR=1 FL=1
MASITSDTLVRPIEDVRKEMDLVGYDDTPFTSKYTAKGTTTQKLHEWLEDVRRAPNLNNAHAEGESFTDNNFGQPSMASNVTQIFHQVVNIAATTDATAVHGRPTESQRQKALSYDAMKRELEATLLSGQAMVASGTRKLASAQALINASNSYATGGAATAPTYDQVKLIGRQGKKKGQKYPIVLVPIDDGDIPGTFVKDTSFVRQIPNSGKDSEIATDVVTIVKTPTNLHNFIMDDFVLATDWLFTTEKAVTLKNLKGRSWTLTKLAKTSDGERYALVGEYTLSLSNSYAAAFLRKVTGVVGGDGIRRIA